MSKADRLFERLMSGAKDANFRFEDLCKLLVQLGYTSRQAKGSHIIFQRGDSFFVPYQAVTDFKVEGYLKKIFVIYQP